MYKRFFIFILIFCAILPVSAKKFVVVLNPGHGGSDPGAVRGKVYESHINLAIALLVGEMLSAHSDIEVVYTRKIDKRLEPTDRTNTAINAKGDIYVSIHTNSAYNEKLKQDVTTTSGVEVYIIEQFDKNQGRSEDVLKKNTNIISIDENNEDVTQKFNPSSLHSDAAFKLKQQQIYNQSTYLALHIQREMGDEKRDTRGVKQGNYYDTWQTGMPSVLVEVGYITNPKEREFLTSAAGQKSLARGIYNGIMAFKKDYVSRSDLPPVPQETTPAQPKPVEQPKVTEPRKPVEQPKVTETPKPVEQPKVTEAPKTEPVAQPAENQVVYKWQIMAGSVLLAPNDASFKGLKDCKYYVQDKLYKYTYGESTDLKEIEKLRTTVKQLFPSAFIIAMKNGERVKF